MTENKRNRSTNGDNGNNWLIITLLILISLIVLLIVAIFTSPGIKMSRTFIKNTNIDTPMDLNMKKNMVVSLESIGNNSSENSSTKYVISLISNNTTSELIDIAGNQELLTLKFKEYGATDEYANALADELSRNDNVSKIVEQIKDADYKGSVTTLNKMIESEELINFDKRLDEIYSSDLNDMREESREILSKKK